MKESRSLNKALKIARPVIIVIAVMVLLGAYHFAVTSMHNKESMRREGCYRELTAIVLNAPQQKAEWIQKTIIAERSMFGGIDYCRVLDLVKESGASNEAPPARKGGMAP